MARHSFVSLTYSASRSRSVLVCLRLYWVFLTCMAWGIVFPSLVRSHILLRKDSVTDLDRFFYDLWRVWEFSISYLTLTLTLGCIVGCSSRGPFRTKWTAGMFACHFIHFIFDSVACRSTYTLLQSRGFNAITKSCQEGRLGEMNVMGILDLSKLCDQTRFNPNVLAIATIIVWKLFTLSLVLLTWIWFLRVIRDDLVAKAMTEGSAQPVTGLIEIAPEETCAAEGKV